MFILVVIVHSLNAREEKSKDRVITKVGRGKTTEIQFAIFFETSSLQRHSQTVFQDRVSNKNMKLQTKCPSDKDFETHHSIEPRSGERTVHIQIHKH